MKLIQNIKKSFVGNYNVIGINERNLSLIYPNNDRKFYKFADDKVLTKEILNKYNIPCSKTYAVIEFIGDIQAGWESVQIYDKIAIKPANGSGGGGIKILKKDKEGNWISGGKIVDLESVFLHMANIIMGQYSLGTTDRVLIEECIIPHPFFHEIFPEGVPDFRVILLNEIPLVGMLRVPTEKSDGKANLHQGGLGIGVDINTGKLMQAYDGKDYFDNHPDNGNMILGKDIPHWDEVLNISINIAKNVPIKYLGVDIVIDKNLGPMIMEINVRPGLGIQLANKIGLRTILEQNPLIA